MAKAMPAMPKKGANLGVNSTDDMAASPVCRYREWFVSRRCRGCLRNCWRVRSMMISVVVSAQAELHSQTRLGLSHVTPAKRLRSLLLHNRRRVAASEDAQVAVTSVSFQSIHYSSSLGSRRSLHCWFCNPYPPPTASTDPSNRDRWLARAESISVHTSLPPHPPRRPRLVRCPSLAHTYPPAADDLPNTLTPSSHLSRPSDPPPLRTAPCGQRSSRRR